MTANIKEKLEDFLMNEDLLNDNASNDSQLQFQFPDDETNNAVDEEPARTGSPVIIDRKVITESGKILLKD